MQVSGLNTVDWHGLIWGFIAVLSALIALVLVFPSDPGVRHKDQDDDDYPRFPPF